MTKNKLKKMNYYKQVSDLFDKWAKDYQKMPEGEDKKLMKAEMDKAVNKFYGKVNIETQNSEEEPEN